MKRHSIRLAQLVKTAGGIDVDILERSVTRSRLTLQVPGFRLLKRLAYNRSKARHALWWLVDCALRYVKYLHRCRSLVCACNEKHLAAVCRRCQEFHEQIKLFLGKLRAIIHCPRLSEKHFPIEVFTCKLALTYIQAYA